MTQSEYNQHVARCAQLALGLKAGSHDAAKAALPDLLAGAKAEVVGSIADAISILRYSALVATADTLSPRVALIEVAWLVHLADVAAKIDTLP